MNCMHLPGEGNWDRKGSVVPGEALRLCFEDQHLQAVQEHGREGILAERWQTRRLELCGCLQELCEHEGALAPSITHISCR